MTGNSSGRCPECNADFKEHVSSPELDEAPRETPQWKTTLTLLFGVLCLLIGVLQAVLAACIDSGWLVCSGGLILLGVVNLLEYRAMQRKVRKNRKRKK
jgi:hypothetical protein